MTTQELRNKGKDTLKLQLYDLRKELMNLRFQKVSGALENTARFRKVRRDIARVKSVQNELKK
ncbi:MAG: 50S ribosomal protein L29 [Alphaproteobacteria bacterium]|nr:50S ribosomal protein L29 [Alphaproteobacteria bacterium]MBT5389699.1 50S ribosomal protein L29 [Alphaproteobacteria bacterium]MBT5654103.1 50S ribosomal protein L29 [Alphaproteobacteria bacterium]